MTIENLTVIGNSWGKPTGTEGVEHYWIHGTGEERLIWISLCGMERLDMADVFSGVPILYLTMERNPIQQDRCELCAAAKEPTGG